jgi:hypothetical protein
VGRKRRESSALPLPLDVLLPIGGKRRVGELNGASLDVFLARLATRQDGAIGRARMVAALIAAGPGAALSHATAAYLWKLIPSMPPFPDVTLTDRAPRTRPALRVTRRCSSRSGSRNSSHACMCDPSHTSLDG